MKLKKLSPIIMSIILAISVSACSKNAEDTTNNKENQSIEVKITDNDKEYVKAYNELYKTKLKDLNKYKLYSSNEESIKYYKDNEYPGNESYLKQLKDSYTNSKIAIKDFTDELKDRAVPGNNDLKKMNESLVSEAKSAIDDIDMKLERIDQIPKELLEKTKEEFIKIVYDTSELRTETENEFSGMVEYLNKKFTNN